jgi:periplasmic protein TonB
MRMSYSLVPVELLPSRTLVAGAIVALHVAVAYLLITGLIHQARPLAEPRTQVHVIIERTPAPPDPIIKPQVVLNRPRFDQPRVPDPPTTPVPAQAPDTPSVADPLAPPAVTGVAVPEDIRVIGKNQLPDTEEYYPPGKRREGVEGASDVRVCVNVQGVRQGEPVLERSSGDADLDRGALNVARHGNYARAVQGGAPVPNCYRFRITFRIR